MGKPQTLRVAIIGAGPRGTSVLERLLAHWRTLNTGGQRLSIHVIDPHEPGAGRIWRTDQSRLYLMNTPSLFPTVVPVGPSAESLPPSTVGLSFDQWRILANDGGVEVLSDADREELDGLRAAGFPSRALYGRYLRWVYAELTANPGRGIEITHSAANARTLQRCGRGFTVELDGGAVLSVDTAVLALGHLPAMRSPEQEKLQDDAARLGLQYWPPAIPADVQWTRLPARKPVLVRGLGLNFFDLMIQLTEGRGGTFQTDEAGRLEYTPSGREPVIIAASRRGVPYRAKAQLDTYLPRSVSLRYCTLKALLSFGAQGIQPGFDHDIWPLLHRDILWTYYTTLARVDSSALLIPTGTLIPAVQEALDEPGRHWKAALRTVLEPAVPLELQLDVEALAHPFSNSGFSGPEDYARAVAAYLDEDIAGSARGEDDPLKMAIGAMNAGRTLIKQVVADGGLTEQSWITELRGWFEPLVEGLASGPPPVRIAQLAALKRAGLVHFIGPSPTFMVDPEIGRFRASSPWVQGTDFSAHYLVEAMTPANRVAVSLSPLMRQLLNDGMVRPRLMMAADGVPVTTPGLDVTRPPYQPVSETGRPQKNLYVLGLQLASTQWGTAIAAEAGASLDSSGRTLRDADDIAGAILAEIQR